ncbi:MAG: aspartate kinase [Clostridiaceae bacterium]
MKILVQKFGGTSVSTPDRRDKVIKKIINAKEKGYAPVVVVSAMGRFGDYYSTDSLLSLLKEDFKSNNKLAKDLLMCCGEIISSVVLCNDLSEYKIDSVPLTGYQAGILTSSNYNNASIKKVDISNIITILNENKIPVISGFQGMDENGFFTTLGRGGSDVTAAVLGGALKADGVEIYTDVDGIMTADPKIVEDASLINEINYNEVFQFAEEGAKVIHPRAVDIAMRYNVPLIIKNTLNDCRGTVINNSFEQSNKIISGITHMPDRIQVVSEDKNINIIKLMADNIISIDLINVFPNRKIFTISKNDLVKIKLLSEEYNLDLTYTENLSKIAIIGSRMRGIPGVMSKILAALEEEGIDVLQTADSHTTIWCLVKKENTNKAIKTLHKEFDLGSI